MAASLQANGYLVLERFGAGSFELDFMEEDALEILAGDATLVDSASWKKGQAPIGTGWGRLPNGTGAFETLAPTKGSANTQAFGWRRC